MKLQECPVTSYGYNYRNEAGIMVHDEQAVYQDWFVSSAQTAFAIDYIKEVTLLVMFW